MGKFRKEKVMLNKKVGFDVDVVQPLEKWTKKELIEEMREYKKEVKELREKIYDSIKERRDLIEKLQEVLGISKLIEMIHKLEVDIDD